MVLKIHPHHPEPRLIGKAVDIVKNGGIVIYPTDTVYGIGCSVVEKRAIERIHLIKQQRTDKPFSFVCADLSHISEYAHVSNAAFRIMKHLVPGPYTFILPAARMKSLPKLLISRRKTVGIRVPDSPIAVGLVRELGHPILSTSVSQGEGDYLNDPDRIIPSYKDVVDLIIDSGLLTSEPSTILDLSDEVPVVVRRGAGDVSRFV